MSEQFEDMGPNMQRYDGPVAHMPDEAGVPHTCPECQIGFHRHLHGCSRGPSAEVDPNRLAAADPGAKLDQGKVDLTYLNDWALALAEVCRVAEFGAKKYSRGGWLRVPDGIRRYTCALFRHLLGLAADDGQDHDAQVAWNALSRLELKLRLQHAKDLRS